MAASLSISAAARPSCVATRCCRAKYSATATGSAPTFSTCGAKPGARRFSSPAPIRNSWRNCSRRKCRRGQNVRLDSKLTGWDMAILTEQEESERRQAVFENSTRVFMESLNVDEVVGQLLASEGFTSVEELALVDVKELAGIEGFDDETANELQSRAREYLEQLETELENKRKALGVDDAF